MDEKKIVWYKNWLDVIFNLSIALTPLCINGDNSIQYPYFPIVMFMLTVSGVSLYALKRESKYNLKVNTLFLFLKPFLLGVVIQIITTHAFDLKTTIENFLNICVIVVLYMWCERPFFSLYKIIGKWAIFDFIIMAITLLITVEAHLHWLIQVVLSLSSFIIAVKLTWKYKLKNKNL
ncbi:hypothetical protein [Candidatus Clostridium helianthi]|uniref:Integral membrane protein n=1 Tax=Candidatus Clostridium helianthi TaxID=3381660 RepID=A0ABW8S195_9CLOT